ncbi:MAG: outer membrane lipoprotein-sorting protein [Bacteroidales bacterium]|nr:outer membrane lipoprotein-sorting protein [Bacteroidales bacterium]
MKKLSLILCLVLFFDQLSIFAQTDDLRAREIVRKAQNITLGINSSSTMTMQIVRPEWSRTVSMQSWSMGTEYYLIYITAPARDKGQVFLKRENNMWNWMPSIGRMIKIPPSMMMSSWMGSDFNNDELMKESSLVVDYTHKIVGEQNLDGYDCYKIELLPLPQAPVVWNKVFLWISKEHDFSLRAEYYGKNDELINEQISSEIKRMDGRLIPSKLIIKPVQKEGQQTILFIDKIKFDDPSITSDMFSQQMMKQVRPN